MHLVLIIVNFVFLPPFCGLNLVRANGTVTVLLLAARICRVLLQDTATLDLVAVADYLRNTIKYLLFSR